MTGATSSGNNEITPIRYIGTRSIVGRPIDDDLPRLEVYLFDDGTDDERDQALRHAVEHEHVVTAGREQVIDPAEHDPRRRTYLEPFEISPVELAFCNRRKPLPRDDDVCADPFAS